LRRRWAARLTPSGTRWARLSRLAPTGTAALVLLVGIGLAGRALLAVAWRIHCGRPRNLVVRERQCGIDYW